MERSNDLHRASPLTRGCGRHGTSPC